MTADILWGACAQDEHNQDQHHQCKLDVGFIDLGDGEDGLVEEVFHGIVTFQWSWI